VKKKYLLISLPAIPCLLSAQQIPQKNRPNIIFIMSDDHAQQAISCYSHQLNSTPNIDRLANEGMRFTNSFVTNSISGPSRAVMLTGRYNHLNGFVDNNCTFNSQQHTFPMILRNNGYQTSIIGKWHLVSNPVGFDYWNILPGQGNYYNPDFIEMGKKSKQEGYVTDLITHFSIRWLNQRDTSKPFCMLIHHKAPHREWMPAPEYLNLYDSITIPEPYGLFDNYEGRGTAARVQTMTIAKDLTWCSDLKINPGNSLNHLSGPTGIPSFHKNYDQMNAEQKALWDEAYDMENKIFLNSNHDSTTIIRWRYQRYIKDYLRCIASVDKSVGKILCYLDSTGLAKNTIVVYTSDQGFYLGEHGWFDKRFMYEESFRMPLLMRYPPLIKPGTIDSNLVLNLDFAPTFLAAAGVVIPDSIQGTSLLPLMKQPNRKPWRKSIYYHYYEYPGFHSVKRHYGIRDHQYKLIHFYYDIDEWEFYDLKADPHEMTNSYNNPAYKKIIGRMKKDLEKLRRQYRVPEDKPVH